MFYKKGDCNDDDTPEGRKGRSCYFITRGPLMSIAPAGGPPWYYSMWSHHRWWGFVKHQKFVIFSIPIQVGSIFCELRAFWQLPSSGIGVETLWRPPPFHKVSLEPRPEAQEIAFSVLRSPLLETHSTTEGWQLVIEISWGVFIIKLDYGTSNPPMSCFVGLFLTVSLRSTFALFDKDKDGEISSEELAKVRID